jgi:hypothetical protein
MDKPLQTEGDLEPLNKLLRKECASEKAVNHGRKMLLVYLEKLKKYNRAILDYNFCAPSLGYHGSIFKVATEIRKAVRNFPNWDLIDLLDIT